MMRTGALAVALAATVVTTASCSKSSTTGPVCTAVAIAGIYINVSDRLTDTPPPFTGLWARAREGTYVDSTTMSFPSSQPGAVSVPLVYERKGTYDVTVHVNGYVDFVRTGVVVTAGECHVNPVLIDARLTKLP